VIAPTELEERSLEFVRSANSWPDKTCQA